MKRSKNSFETVLRLIESEEQSLVNLAVLAGVNPFDFYQGAKLVGLDLSNQDLRGLNFERADMRSTNLDNVKVDIGALNGCRIDHKYLSLKDEFDFFLDDICESFVDALYFFARFRTSTLEQCFNYAGVTYGRFCDDVNINAQTLRKARRSQMVSGDTAIAISRGMRDALMRIGNRPLFNEVLQPMIAIFSLSGDRFTSIKRSSLNEVLTGLAQIGLIDKSLRAVNETIDYRASPSSAIWFAEAYSHDVIPHE